MKRSKDITDTYGLPFDPTDMSTLHVALLTTELTLSFDNESQTMLGITLEEGMLTIITLNVDTGVILGQPVLVANGTATLMCK